MRPTGGMGYRGMGQMGNRGTGVWVTWAMGTWTMGYRDIGNWAHGQWGPWAICTQNVKKMSSCQKDVMLSKRCQMSKNQTPRL